jgi:hypothetical protein
MKKVTFREYADQLRAFAEKHGGSYKETSNMADNKIYKSLSFSDGANWYEVTTDVTEFWNTDNSKSLYTA